MISILKRLVVVGIVLGTAAIFIVIPRPPYIAGPAGYRPDPINGEYMTNAAGCISCHTLTPGSVLLGGGVKLETPFGTLGSPNISSSRSHGIGSWTDADFLNAVKAGISPENQHYFPGFPYARYAGLSDRDVLDIKSFIFSLPEVNRNAPKHEMSFPFNVRLGVGFWKLANFNPVDAITEIGRSQSYLRGKYLVEYAAHCGECHTPRNITLGLDQSRAFEGAIGFDGVEAPALNSEYLAAIDESAFVIGVFVNGLRLDGQQLDKEKMIEVAQSIRHLSYGDRKAIYTYLTERD